MCFCSNGSSTPPRLPLLSKVLIAANRQSSDAELVMAALSYRGYWTSSGRPSQRGIEKDAQAFVQWAETNFPSCDIVLWGQSIGAGIAAHACATSLGRDESPKIVALILETPFVSIRRMLAALYPERWVPYKYLWPFLRNWWDTEQALALIAAQARRPEILLLAAAQDEVVPATEVEDIESICKRQGLLYTRFDVPRALHNEASSRASGVQALANFLHKHSGYSSVIS